MQLGARWRAGDTPHPGVPPQLHACIAEQESRHPGAGSWTLTWLEGRPRCALDDRVVVTLDAAGAAVLERTPSGAAAPQGPADPDDDDDDWLA